MTNEEFPDELPETDPVDGMDLIKLQTEFVRENLKTQREMKARAKTAIPFRPFDPRDQDWCILILPVDSPSTTAEIKNALADGYVPYTMGSPV